MIKAVIFDLNGTLTDDLWYHIETYYRTINEAGVKVTKKEIEQLLGKPCEEITKILAENHKKKVDERSICKEKRKMFLEITRGKESKVIIKNAEYVLKKLKERSIKLGLFTGSSRDNILMARELIELFDEIIAGIEVKKVKPNPEGLHKIMKKLRVKKSECIYVGDLPIDMMTAKNAGIKGIGLKNKRASEKKLLETGAVKVIKDLKELLSVMQ